MTWTPEPKPLTAMLCSKQYRAEHHGPERDSSALTTHVSHLCECIRVGRGAEKELGKLGKALGSQVDAGCSLKTA